MTKDLKYCVYIHTTLDGVPFYVGSGTEERAKRLRRSSSKLNDRGKRYSEFIEQLDYRYSYNIIASGLSKEESNRLEIATYHDLLTKGILLVNSRIPNMHQKMDHISFDRLYYDSTSLSGLRWKTPLKHSNKKFGDTAGCRISDHGHQVNYDGNSYYTHRVVMVLHGISIDGCIVDHINGNVFDNSFENLRVCDYATNARNRAKSTVNTSGVTGVHYDSYDDQWVASMTLDGKKLCKTFNVRKYGNDEAFALACKAREEMLRQSGSFTERHGTIKQSLS